MLVCTQPGYVTAPTQRLLLPTSKSLMSCYYSCLEDTGYHSCFMLSIASPLEHCYNDLEGQSVVTVCYVRFLFVFAQLTKPKSHQLCWNGIKVLNLYLFGEFYILIKICQYFHSFTMHLKWVLNLQMCTCIRHITEVHWFSLMHFKQHEKVIYIIFKIRGL